jgi:hypothetical protein
VVEIFPCGICCLDLHIYFLVDLLDALYIRIPHDEMVVESKYKITLTIEDP